MSLKTPPAFIAAFLSLSFFVLNGCTTPQERAANDPEIELNQINISMDADANLNSALSLDLLVIYKKDLLDAIMKMTAKDYRAASQQIQRDFPDMVDVWHWELTPGQYVKQYPVILKGIPTVGAVIFADYLSPGDHRIRLGDQDKITIRAKRDDFCILELGCAGDLNKIKISQKSFSRKNEPLDALEGKLNQADSEKSSDASKNGEDPKKLLKQGQSIFKQFKK